MTRVDEHLRRARAAKEAGQERPAESGHDGTIPFPGVSTSQHGGKGLRNADSRRRNCPAAFHAGGGRALKAKPTEQRQPMSENSFLKGVEPYRLASLRTETKPLRPLPSLGLGCSNENDTDGEALPPLLPLYA